MARYRNLAAHSCGGSAGLADDDGLTGFLPLGGTLARDTPPVRVDQGFFGPPVKRSDVPSLGAGTLPGGAQARPRMARASAGDAGWRSYSAPSSATRATSSALLLASRVLSYLMLSSSPVRGWPPSSRHQ